MEMEYSQNQLNSCYVRGVVQRLGKIPIVKLSVIQIDGVCFLQCKPGLTPGTCCKLRLLLLQGKLL